MSNTKISDYVKEQFKKTINQIEGKSVIVSIDGIKGKVVCLSFKVMDGDGNEIITTEKVELKSGDDVTLFEIEKLFTLTFS